MGAATPKTPGSGTAAKRPGGAPVAGASPGRYTGYGRISAGAPL
jgi:hypothetical protein